MKNKISIFMIFTTLLFLSFSNIVRAEIDIKTPAWQKVKSLGKENYYIFLFFGDTKTEKGEIMFTTLDGVRKELSKVKKVDIIKVAIDSPEERELVEFFRIIENPTVVVITPNGAVTGYFTKPAEKKVLSESLVSVKESEIIKQLQEGQIVFLCFYKTNESSFSSIKTDLESIANNFRGATKVIYIRNNDKNEDKLKSKFEILSNSNGPTTVFIIIPPGKAVAKLTGDDITKENLMSALYRSCSLGSCSPGGCK